MYSLYVKLSDEMNPLIWAYRETTMAYHVYFGQIFKKMLKKSSHKADSRKSKVDIKLKQGFILFADNVSEQDLLSINDFALGKSKYLSSKANAIYNEIVQLCGKVPDSVVFNKHHSNENSLDATPIPKCDEFNAAWVW